MDLDFNKLKRNYNNQPINGWGDKPEYEDLLYLYITLNLSAIEIAEIVGSNKSKVLAWLSSFKITKSKEMRKEATKNYWLKKYGVDNPRKLKEVQEKAKQTNLEKYGHVCAIHSKEIKEKMIQNNLDKYGVEYAGASKQARIKREQNNMEKFGCISPFGNNEIRQKIKNTNKERYGFEYATQNQDIQEKTMKTNLEKYGTKAPSQSEIVKQKTIDNNMKKYGVAYPMQLQQFQDRVRKTNLEKYGTTSSSANAVVKEKVKETNLKRYGKEYAIQTQEIKEKRRSNNIAKWGTSNISTKHIDLKMLEILNDKEKFIKVIQDTNIRNINELAKYFGITYSGMAKKICEHNCESLIDKFTSRYELELRDMLPDFYKTKKVIYPLEIDLYNEYYKFGIEFNGDYWHSEILKDKKYHQNKSEIAKSKGIFIYHIFEYEWTDDRINPIICSQLKNLTRGNDNKIAARKCIINELSAAESNKFLNENHLQGEDKSSIRYGLFYNNELLAVMTFCKPRFNKKYNWELSRFCCKKNFTIIGGASKLFKHFLSTYKGSIISYCDISKGTGQIYNKLGFTYLYSTEPNYVWSNGYGEKYTRYQTQKHKLKDYQEYGNTEVEIMHNRGFYRIYDCGNQVWEYNNIK